MVLEMLPRPSSVVSLAQSCREEPPEEKHQLENWHMPVLPDTCIFGFTPSSPSLRLVATIHPFTPVCLVDRSGDPSFDLLSDPLDFSRTCSQLLHP
jgi:hypothetical protein